MSKHQMEHGDFYDPLMVRVRCSHTWSNVLAPNTGAGCMNVSAGNRRGDECGPGCWCEEPLENVATSMWLVAPSRPCAGVRSCVQAQACPSVCVTVSFIMLSLQTTWSAPCQPSNAPCRRRHREHHQRLQNYTDSTNHGSAQHWLPDD